jgi:hypothetical protein
MDSPETAVSSAFVVVTIVAAGIVCSLWSSSFRKKCDGESVHSKAVDTASSGEGRTVHQAGTVDVDDSDFGGQPGLSLEVRRDFSRYFSSDSVVFLLSDRGGAAGTGGIAELRSFQATVPNVDYVAESNDRSVANFRALLARELLRARVDDDSSTDPHDDLDDDAAAAVVNDVLLTACVRCITVNVGFKVAMERVACPVFLQPTFVVVLRGGACHLVNYGFVGMGRRGVGVRQSTDRVVRICSPDLLAATGALGAGATGARAEAATRRLTFSFEVYDAQYGSAVDEVRRDVEATAGRLGLR